MRESVGSCPRAGRYTARRLWLALLILLALAELYVDESGLLGRLAMQPQKHSLEHREKIRPGF